MDANDGQPTSTLSTKGWKELVENVDRETDSPEIRASKILDLIKKHDPNINTYDLWCFSIHILQTLYAQYPEKLTETAIKVLHKLLYQLHYRLKIWKNIPK